MGICKDRDMTILDRITEFKKKEVAEQKRRGPELPDIDTGKIRGFRDNLMKSSDISIIAEVKRASPSKGLLCPDFDPVAIARDYEQGGAAAVSVLTDRKFFQGSLEYLARIRQQVNLPLLRKDFIIDHFQVDQARAWGADAVLLIVAILDQVLMEELMAHAAEKGLDSLVEVHDEAEAIRAMKAGADLLGVNNRNLKDFSVSLDTTYRLRQAVPDDIPLVSESGISTAREIRELANSGICAVLIGESLVKANDRQSKLRELIGI